MTRSPQRRWRRLVPVAAVAGALTTVAPVSLAGATTPAEGEGSGCPAPGEYDTEGEFVYAHSTDLRSYDPDRVGSGTDLVFLWPVYDTLLHEGPTGELQPMLAESWEIAEDGSSITLNLREGLTFHDGTALDAEAVVANLERSRTLDGGFNVTALSDVTAVTATGPTVVEIEVSGGAVSTLLSLAGAAGMMKSPATFELDHLEMATTGGSGAFRLDEVVTGVSSSYTRVEDYWDTGNSWGFGTMRIDVIGDLNARLNALITGQVDAALGGASINQAAVDAGFIWCTASSVSGNVISLNTSRSEFGNPLVRQALAHAIDREGITQVVLPGSCTANVQRFPAWFYAANPDIAPDAIPFDLDAARALLDEAGVDGFSFDIHVPADAGAYMKIAEVIQQSYAEIGVTMNIVPSELHTILEDFRSGNADAHLAPLTVTEPAGYLASFYLAGGVNNPGGWEPEGMAELFEQLDAATSTEEQAPVFAEMAQVAFDEMAPIIPICNLELAYLVSPDLGGLEVSYNNARNFRTVTAD